MECLEGVLGMTDYSNDIENLRRIAAHLRAERLGDSAVTVERAADALDRLRAKAVVDNRVIANLVAQNSHLNSTLRSWGIVAARRQERT